MIPIDDINRQHAQNISIYSVGMRIGDLGAINPDQQA